MRPVLPLCAMMWLAACAPIDVIPLDDGGAPADARASDARAPDASVPPAPPGEVGGGICDHQGSCDTCRACSHAPLQQCNALALACEDDASCLALGSCVSRCRDSRECTDACVVAHAAGRDRLVALLLCEVCDACPRDCAEHASSCVGAPPF